MNPRKVRVFFLSLVLIVFGATSALAQIGTTVYNHNPTPLPPNVASVGYQANQTAEFGDDVFLAPGTDRHAGSATVVMSDWAKHSTYPTMPAAGWNHPITLNLYAVDHSGPNPALGASLGSVTQSFLIPWRPEHTAGCPGDSWLAGDGSCYNGLAFKITFDLRSLNLTFPNEVIVGVAFNTETWGYHPIGLPGPYNSLNAGLDEGAPATVGLDAESDAVFWNTATPSNYTDGGAGGVGIFRRDTAWSPFAPAFQLNAFTAVTNKDACKNGGWQTLTRADGSPFKNQGDCVSYTNNGK